METCFLVTGAGSSFCNGEYLFDGYFDSVPKWSRTCVVTSEDKMGNRVERTAILTIFRSKCRTSSRGSGICQRWILSSQAQIKTSISTVAPHQQRALPALDGVKLERDRSSTSIYSWKR